MLTVQYIAIVVTAGLMVYILGEYGRKRIEWRELIFWEILLSILFIITLKPEEVSILIKNILGIGRGLDALFILAIGLSYLMLLRIHLQIDRVEREITDLTRKIAIELEEINEKLEGIEKRG